MKKTKKIVIIAVLLTILTICIPSNIQAGECEYGTINVYFSKNQTNWKKATVNNISLKRGETFYIKAEITSKIDLLSIDLKIWETAEQNQKNSTFIQLTGPDCFFGVYDIIDVKEKENITLNWKFQVKSDTDWFNATAPLNILAQFDKNTQDNKKIFFTVVNPYIKNEIWEQYNPEKQYTGNIYQNNSTVKQNSTNSTTSNLNTSTKLNKTPGFEIIFFISAALIISLWKRKK